MFEEYTPNSDGGRKHWKPFQHYKHVSGERAQLPTWDYEMRISVANCKRCDLSTCPPWSTYKGTSTTLFGNPGELDLGLPPLYSKQSDGNFIPSPTNLETLKQHSLNGMMPGIKAGLSLLNSIYELKDFKRPVLTSLRKLRTFKEFLATKPNLKAVIWKHMRPKYDEHLKKLGVLEQFLYKEPSLSDVARAVAGGYLELSFNLLPLQSDVSAVYRALRDTRSAINDLVSRAGRPQVRHYAYKWNEFADQTTDSANYFVQATSHVDPSVWIAQREVVYDSSVFHAELAFCYDLRRYNSVIAQIDAYLDAFGVNVNPAIIWNAIPFTFVIDWVFGVSRFLNQFSVKNMEPQIRFQSYLWSVKRSRRITVWCKHHPSYATAYPKQGEVRLPEVHQSAYRRVITPPSASSIVASGLNLKEFSLGAALAYTFKRKRKYQHGGRVTT